MLFEDLAALSRRDRIRIAAVILLLSAAVVWATVQLLQPFSPRHIVMASGPEGGIYNVFASRYKELLGRQGVTVDVRMTRGAGDNYRLLLDPKSGVDVAFIQGGVASPPDADRLVMLASLYYEPLWIFYRDERALKQLNELRGKRIAVGVPGSGTRALVTRLLAANGLTPAGDADRDDTEIVPLGGQDALDALKARQIDAALFVGGADTPLIQQALRDPAIKLMSLVRADAYPRGFPFVTKLTLPAGTIDLATNIPAHDVAMIGTKAMLAARDDLHPALINLLLDAAREIHGRNGYFEAAGEFPGTAQVDIPVSRYADEHRRFGPTFLHRYMPFWLATSVERAIILLVPLVAILVPSLNLLPQFVRWRTRSRIYRWYGRLALLEHDVRTREGALPIDTWLRELAEIERAVEQIRTPASFASEAYTLREHIALVRRAVLAKTGTVARAGAADVAV